MAHEIDWMDITPEDDEQVVEYAHINGEIEEMEYGVE